MASKSTNSNEGRYIASGPLMRMSARGKIQRIAGGVFLGILLLGLLGMLLEESSRLTLKKNIVYYVVFLAIGGFVLFLGLRNRARVRAANRYASLFRADRDGIVSRKELADKTAKSETAVMEELDRLFALGLFQNCALEKGGTDPGVVLADAQSGGAGFINVKCPNCGGTTRIRCGVVGKCDWCGSPVRGEK